MHTILAACRILVARSLSYVIVLLVLLLILHAYYIGRSVMNETEYIHEEQTGTTIGIEQSDRLT
jgi:hypothetical protein